MTIQTLRDLGYSKLADLAIDYASKENPGKAIGLDENILYLFHFPHTVEGKTFWQLISNSDFDNARRISNQNCIDMYLTPEEREFSANEVDGESIHKWIHESHDIGNPSNYDDFYMSSEEEKDEWIDVGSEMPNPYVDCFVADRYGNIFIACLDHDDQEWKEDPMATYYLKGITHWMPIVYPQPPKK